MYITGIGTNMDQFHLINELGYVNPLIKQKMSLGILILKDSV